MPVNPAQDELYTVVQNLTGATRSFSFLGPRGMRLAAAETVTIPGDLLASLGAMAQQGGRRRKFDGLETAIKNGDLQIDSRPAPVLYDATNEQPVSLAVVGGILGTVDPTYGSDDSDSFASVHASP